MSALLFSSKNHARYAVRIAVTAFIKNVTTTEYRRSLVIALRYKTL